MGLYFILPVVVFLFFAGVLTVLFVFLSGGRRKRFKVSQRLEEIKESKRQRTVILEGGKGGNPFVKILTSCGRLAVPEGGVKRRSLERKLHAAGIYSENALPVYLGLRVLLPAVLLFIVACLSPVLMHYPVIFIAAIAWSILLGIFAPVFVLRFMARRRKSAIIKGFPDALDLLAVCTEAGVSFDAAIKKVAEDMALLNKHISREFMTYIYESQLNIPRHEALRNLAGRMDIEVIKAFVTLLIQSDKLGTSIVSTLRGYSDSLRTKRRQDAETRAARLPVLLIFPLMFLIFPSLYLVILGPATISIFKNLIAK
ncbi:MAG: type II secretion system F family protein [Candidatus Brocadiales bacterium]